MLKKDEYNFLKRNSLIIDSIAIYLLDRKSDVVSVFFKCFVIVVVAVIKSIREMSLRMQTIA